MFNLTVPEMSCVCDALHSKFTGYPSPLEFCDALNSAVKNEKLDVKWGVSRDALVSRLSSLDSANVHALLDNVRDLFYESSALSLPADLADADITQDRGNAILRYRMMDFMSDMGIIRIDIVREGEFDGAIQADRQATEDHFNGFPFLHEKAVNLRCDDVFDPYVLPGDIGSAYKAAYYKSFVKTWRCTWEDIDSRIYNDLLDNVMEDALDFITEYGVNAYDENDEHIFGLNCDMIVHFTDEEEASNLLKAAKGKVAEPVYYWLLSFCHEVQDNVSLAYSPFIEMRDVHRALSPLVPG